VALSGTSIGAAIFPTITVAALAQHDWRQVLTGMAVLPLVILPVVALLLRAGGKLSTAADDRPVTAGPSRHHRPLSVILLLVAIFATFFSSTAFLLNLFLYLQDIGLTAQATALGVSSVFIVGLVAKVLIGLAAERWGVFPVWRIHQCILLAGALILSIGRPDIAFPGLILLGLGWAGCYVLTQVVISDVFAGPQLGRIAGGFIVFEAISSGSGVWSAAAIADHFGSYRWAFILCCGLLTLAIATTMLFQRSLDRTS
jgi:MFS family permease